MDCFGDKIILSAFFIDWKCRWLQSGLADFEKYQTRAFFDYGRFLRIFKISHFKRFLKDFFKSSGANAKMVECILFYANMVAQTQQNSISPFCDKNFGRQ